MNTISFLKRQYILVLLAVFSICINSCTKDSVVETQSQQVQSEVISFAKQHLPAQTFGALNWQALRPVILADTVFGWFAYPSEALPNMQEYFFIGALGSKPVEIVQYKLSSSRANHAQIDNVYSKAWVAGREKNQPIVHTQPNAATGNEEITTMSHPESTLPEVVVVGQRKEVKKVVYIRAANLSQDYTQDYNMYTNHEYIAATQDSWGGAYNGGLDASINISEYDDYYIWKHLYLYLPNDYPGMDVGLHWKWWLDGSDKTEENIDAAFFNLENLRLNREEAIWALKNPVINKLVKAFLTDHELDIKALIAAKSTLRHAQYNLLGQPQLPQHLQIVQASYNEFECCPPNPLDPSGYAAMLAMKVAFLKKEHPNWSDLRCYLEAQLDIFQSGLDVIGLIPVVGEVCDLTNGVIYTIRGDGINAGLSFAATIPIAGWFATGAKWAMTTVVLANGKTLKLLWNSVNGIIDFGNRGQLREVLQITSSSLQAHHIIPWALGKHKVVQKAAKSGNAFHMNELLNGLPVASWRNQPNHDLYNKLIQSKLDALPDNLSPNDAYIELTKILSQAKQAINNFPNKHLNDITF